MVMTHLQLGSLACTLVSSSKEPPQALVVLCHGYGAQRTDLVDVAHTVQRLLPEAGRVHFLFPEGPLSLAEMGAPQGRAWWHLDIAYLQRRQRMGEAGLKALQGETFAGLAPARRQLRQTLELALRQANLPYQRLVLGGFSQGAMLATDVALSLEEAPASLVVLSGTLIDAGRWQTLARRRNSLRVVQCHGRVDPILPYAGAVALHELLVACGLSCTFLPFEGGHSVPAEALEALAGEVAPLLHGA